MPHQGDDPKSDGSRAIHVTSQMDFDHLVLNALPFLRSEEFLSEREKAKAQ